MEDVISNTTTSVPDFYVTPSFPSLYWLIGPPGVVHPAYLYNWSDIWRFTVFWNILVYEAAYLLAASYAVIIIWWSNRGRPSKSGGGRKVRRWRVWSVISGSWAIPAIYIIVAGLEAVIAGSIVGLV